MRFFVAFFALCGTLCAMSRSEQVVMHDSDATDSGVWSVQLDSTWDVLGPFSIAAREQYFLSPSYPLDLEADTLDFESELNKTYPSSLADGGLVSWSKTQMTPEGNIDIVYPDIRWASLRNTEGWAILQHHSLLRTTLTITPSSRALSCESSPINLLVSVTQASFFALVPRGSPHNRKPVEWHTGNIYGLESYSPSIIELPPSSAPLVYDMFISADYEIRLFGDPVFSAGRPEPVTKVKVDIGVEKRKSSVMRIPKDDVVADFVGGWGMGEALGVAVRAGEEGVVLDEVRLHEIKGLTVELVLPDETPTFHLAPYQKRIIPLRLVQASPLPDHITSLIVNLTFHSTSGTHTFLSSSLPIRHLPHWSTHTRHEPLRATYFLSLVPIAFLTVPPLYPLPPSSTSSPILLALHGAGVSLSFPSWPASIPRQNYSWTVFPQGRTEWGMDWHGPSAQDTWGCTEAVRELTSWRGEGREWGRWQAGSETVVIGHSNGGQGTWFFAGRWPDRLLGVVPSSAWLTAPHYVSLSYSRSIHFVDPSLRGILDSSLTHDSNDLFLSNIVGLPILALHGGDDENVPVWHSREAVAGVKHWSKDADARYIEVPGKPHWWDDVFKSKDVASFLHKLLEEPRNSSVVPDEFTLTVACPDEAGSMFGWAITELQVPGRLGRLHVRRVEQEGALPLIYVTSTNVHTFKTGVIADFAAIYVDGVLLALPSAVSCTISRSESPSMLYGLITRASTHMRFISQPPIWEFNCRAATSRARPIGPVLRVLSSPAPLLFVIPKADPHASSLATRLAHSLYLYVRVDAEIVSDEEALLRLEARSLGIGNLVVFGSQENAFGKRLLSLKHSPFSFDQRGSSFALPGRAFTEPATGLIFLHPHPMSQMSLAVFLCGTDLSGFERALRLFPLRSGVPLPEWAVIGKDADWKGMGGILAAGWWDREWKWSKDMTWSA